MTYFQQAFTAADGTSPTALGFTIVRSTGTAICTVQGNRMGTDATVNGSTGAKYVVDVGSANMRIEGTFNHLHATGHQLIGRLTNYTNYTYLRPTASTSGRVYTVVNGTPTFVTVAWGRTLAVGDRVALEFEGTTRRVFLWNTTTSLWEQKYTDTAGVDPVGNTVGTNAGFDLIGTTGTVHSTLDDFVANSVGSVAPSNFNPAKRKFRTRHRQNIIVSGFPDEPSLVADYWVDFDSGSDLNTGTKASPFKHDPDDPNATGNALAASTLNKTIVYKSGVRYHGSVVPRQNGCIRLGKGWGNGRAIFDGADPISGSWVSASADAVLTNNPMKANIEKISFPVAPSPFQFLRFGKRVGFLASGPSPRQLLNITDTRSFAKDHSLEFVTKSVVDPTGVTYDSGGGVMKRKYDFPMPQAVALMGGISVVGMRIAMLTEPNFPTFKKTVMAQSGNTLTIGDFPSTDVVANPSLTGQPDHGGIDFYKLALVDHPMLIRKPGQFSWYGGFYYAWRRNTEQAYVSIRKVAFDNSSSKTDLRVTGFVGTGFWGDEDVEGGKFWNKPSNSVDAVMTVEDCYLYGFQSPLKIGIIESAGSARNGGKCTVRRNIFHDLMLQVGVTRLTNQTLVTIEDNVVQRCTGTALYASASDNVNVLRNRVTDYYSNHGGPIKLYSRCAGGRVAENFVAFGQEGVWNLQGDTTITDANMIIENNICVMARGCGSYPMYGNSMSGVTERRNTFILSDFGRDWGDGQTTYALAGQVSVTYGSSSNQNIVVEDNIISGLTDGRNGAVNWTNSGNLLLSNTLDTNVVIGTQGRVLSTHATDKNSWTYSTQTYSPFFAIPKLKGEARKADGTYSGALFPDGTLNTGGVFTGSVTFPITVKGVDNGGQVAYWKSSIQLTG